MDAANCSLAAGLVSASYVNQGAAALAARRKLVKALLSNRTLPAEGWDEATIEMLLQDAALMDSNTFPGQVGLGEREGRVACPMVARRHGMLAHGIGRSGDITAEQPKAAGSSLLAKLCAALAADALKIAGLHEQGPAVVLPCATGMTLTLVLLAAAAGRGAPPVAAPAAAEAGRAAAKQPPEAPPLPQPSAAAAADAVGRIAKQSPGSRTYKQSVAAGQPAATSEACNNQQQQQQQQGNQAEKPQQQQQQQQQQQRKQYVIWSRIDQKTCLKSITAANLTPVVIELVKQGDELTTDVEGIRAAVEQVGPESVAAVVTTTSCFAPSRTTQRYGWNQWSVKQDTDPVRSDQHLPVPVVL